MPAEKKSAVNKVKKKKTKNKTKNKLGKSICLE